MDGQDVSMRQSEVVISIPPNGVVLSREITIIKVLNGFVVKIGCQTVVFETKEKMLKELSRYLDNPQEVEKEYLGKK